MLHSEQKCEYAALSGALWDIEQVHSGICEIVHEPCDNTKYETETKMADILWTKFSNEIS